MLTEGDISTALLGQTTGSSVAQHPPSDRSQTQMPTGQHQNRASTSWYLSQTLP